MTINSLFGACTVSRNIYERRGTLKWCIREEGKRDVDCGWVFLSDIDTDEYLSDVNNWCILAFETVVEIEPAILAIYDMPVGTDLTLVIEKGGRRFFIETHTGKIISDIEYPSSSL